MQLIDALKRRILGSRRDRGVGSPNALPDLASFTLDVEAILAQFDFEEVTDEDRITFVELAVEWQVRRALERRRFDLAVQFRQYRDDRIARLRARAGTRPALDRDSRSHS